MYNYEYHNIFSKVYKHAKLKSVLFIDITRLSAYVVRKLRNATP